MMVLKWISSGIHLTVGWLRGFLGGSAGKESACSVGDLGSIPGLGRSPGEGNGYALQNSGLENSMDSRVHGVAKSPTRLSDFQFQWLRLCASNAEAAGLIPGQETKVPHAVCGVANKKWVFFSFQLSKSEKLKLILK